MFQYINNNYNFNSETPLMTMSHNKDISVLPTTCIPMLAPNTNSKTPCSKSTNGQENINSPENSNSSCDSSDGNNSPVPRLLSSSSNSSNNSSYYDQLNENTYQNSYSANGNSNVLNHGYYSNSYTLPMNRYGYNSASGYLYNNNLNQGIMNGAQTANNVITPNTLFKIARAKGTFSPNLLIKNGFAIGNYFRYWQNLFDLRPCPSIYAITITYEILGKEKTPTFLLKYFEDKFLWLHKSMPLGSMYARAHGPTLPPTTIEMMYAFGEEAWTNGNGPYLVRYTRHAETYIKEMQLPPLTPNEDLHHLPPLNMEILMNTLNSILY